MFDEIVHDKELNTNKIKTNDVIYDGSFAKNALYKYALFLESFLTSPQGQLISFNDDLTPNYVFEVGKDKKMELLDQIYDGIKEFINDYMEINPNELKDIDLDRNIIVNHYKSFIENKKFTESMSKVFEVEDLYGSNRIVNIIDEIK